MIELESFAKDFQERMKGIYEECRLWTKLRLLITFEAPASEIRDVIDEISKLNERKGDV